MAEVLLVPGWMMFLLGVLLIAVAAYLVLHATRLLENAVLGVIALLLINFLGMYWGLYNRHQLAYCADIRDIRPCGRRPHNPAQASRHKHLMGGVNVHA